MLFIEKALTLIFGNSWDPHRGEPDSKKNGWYSHGPTMLWKYIHGILNCVTLQIGNYADEQDNNLSRQPWSFQEFSGLFLRKLIKKRSSRIPNTRKKATPIVFSTLPGNMLRSVWCIAVPLEFSLGSRQQGVSRVVAPLVSPLSVSEIGGARENLLTVSGDGKVERDCFQDICLFVLKRLMGRVVLVCCLKDYSETKKWRLLTDNYSKILDYEVGGVAVVNYFQSRKKAVEAVKAAWKGSGKEQGLKSLEKLYDSKTCHESVIDALYGGRAALKSYVEEILHPTGGNLRNLSAVDCVEDNRDQLLELLNAKLASNKFTEACKLVVDYNIHCHAFWATYNQIYRQYTLNRSAVRVIEDSNGSIQLDMATLHKNKELLSRYGFDLHLIEKEQGGRIYGRSKLNLFYSKNNSAEVSAYIKKLELAKGEKLNMST